MTLLSTLFASSAMVLSNLNTERVTIEERPGSVTPSFLSSSRVVKSLCNTKLASTLREELGDIVTLSTSFASSALLLLNLQRAI